MLDRLLAAYRRTGADPPFSDPRRAHGVRMEGYYWRFTDVARGRVVVALCGVSRAPGGSWATVALAAHPGGFVRHAVVMEAEARELDVEAGEVLRARPGHLKVDLGSGTRLEARLEGTRPWPHRALGALGPGHLLPWLPQYWHPHVLGGAVAGTVRIGEQEWDLAGSTVYAEKNWGGDFPGVWWWGQAHGFEDPRVCVAFAGGRVGGLSPTAAVVALPDRVHRFPLARAADGGWRLRAPGLEIEGAASGPPHVLPVPVSAEQRVHMRSDQHLAGRVHVTLRRRGRTLFRGESNLAGLERGRPA